MSGAGESKVEATKVSAEVVADGKKQDEGSVEDPALKAEEAEQPAVEEKTEQVADVKTEEADKAKSDPVAETGDGDSKALQEEKLSQGVPSEDAKSEGGGSAGKAGPKKAKKTPMRLGVKSFSPNQTSENPFDFLQGEESWTEVPGSGNRRRKKEEKSEKVVESFSHPEDLIATLAKSVQLNPGQKRWVMDRVMCLPWRHKSGSLLKSCEFCGMWGHDAVNCRDREKGNKGKGKGKRSEIPNPLQLQDEQFDLACTLFVMMGRLPPGVVDRETGKVKLRAEEKLRFLAEDVGSAVKRDFHGSLEDYLKHFLSGKFLGVSNSYPVAPKHLN